MGSRPDMDYGSTKNELHKRNVEVVTVPIKDIGSLRRAGLRLASWIFGSPLTWAMHWAIRVDGTYFELHRPGGMAKPCLRTSIWSEEKERGIIATVPIGSTTLSDDEIVAASEPYFTERTRLMWYNIYINNCQLFVQFSLERICPVTQSLNPVPPALHNTVSLVLSMAIHTFSLPPILLYIQWLRWRGCDQRSLQAYAALYTSATGLAVPMAIILLIQNYNHLKSVFEAESLFIAAYATFVTSIMVSGLFLIQPRLSFPVAKQRKNGNWEVSTIQKQNSEENVDPEVKIKVTHLWISAIIGASIGVVLWVIVATPYITRRSAAFLSGRLAFRSPLAFGVSVWELLTMPIFELDNSKAVENDNDTTGSEGLKTVMNADYGEGAVMSRSTTLGG
ncbi:hypothetical protein B0H63DRAFT_121170 [Podospora didyma]|uniref:Uncharacterized protein n=1 Tax=Podospora didyma TaxID=330526 RepID=A0AAE0U4M1_9PEZI|nr:hypothetical protein B0H63DRAFT_121170 [Podospora didyma]